MSDVLGDGGSTKEKSLSLLEPFWVKIPVSIGGLFIEHTFFRVV